MDNILIHIGLHKTGTTWLQNELFTTNNDVFEPMSMSKISSGHSTLADDFIFDQNNNLLNSFDNNTMVINKSLQSILDAKNTDKIFVMSHERLSGYPSSSGFDAAAISKRIKLFFPNGKILIVIREQASCIFSNYFQYLKEGGTKSLKTYLNTKYDGRIPGFSENYFKYHFLIDAYQKLFGAENVLVLPYEMFRTNKSLFLETLGNLLDKSIRLPSETYDNAYNVKRNYCVDYKFRFLNNYIKSSSSLNGNSSLRFYTSKKLAIKLKSFLCYITPESRNIIIKKQLQKEIEHWCKGRFEASNKRSSELIGLNLKGFGYKVP